MPVATATPQAAPVSMQGIAIPAAVVDKNAFFARTRRRVQQEKSLSFTLGQSTRDTIELRKSAGGTDFTLTEQGVYLDGLDNSAQRRQGTEELLDALAKSL